MRKLEVEHCDLIHSHSDTVRQIQEKIPEEQEIRGLADFFKVFADATRIRILCVLSCSEMIWRRHWIWHSRRFLISSDC